jgi:mannose/cellobiose epimerase-like protein (N-acyl-D-glucosamine 2-epimerase family)
LNTSNPRRLVLDRSGFRQELEEELTGNILPFWMAHVVDRVNGGFYGAVTNSLQVDNSVPRSAILCARVLWTFAAVYQTLGDEQYLAMAQWAYDYLTRVFWDQDYGGVYWLVDHEGNPVCDRKHRYAQAFAMYGLAEYYQTGHLRLFFDDQWRSLSQNVSYGHDIEGSWLLCEAAEAAGNPAMLEQTHKAAIQMAEAVYGEGLDKDGSLFYESGPEGLTDASKSWWPQAEAVVGFYNAYQLSTQHKFAQAADRCWTYIQAKMVDRTNGDWFKRVHRDGTPDATSYKAGPWECPYHHGRTCLEMLARLHN